MARVQWLRILLVGIGVVLVGVTSPGTSAARPLITGLSGLLTNEPLAMQRVESSGASLVQVVLNWGAIAPRQKPVSWQSTDPADPNYKWAAADASVRNAVAAGLVPVILVNGGPSWVNRCDVPEFARTLLCDPDPEAFADFAAAAARRYSGQFQGLPRVRYWQGLNEPNLSLFFNPQFQNGKAVSATLYRRLINAFYFAVKSVDPSNLVLAAGLGPVAVPRYTIGPMRFTRELLCMVGRRNPHPSKGSCEGGVHFDIFDVHPYTTGGPMHEGRADDVGVASLEKLQELLKAADRAGRIKGKLKRTPLWITEFSWDSKPPDPGGLPMGLLTRWASVALYQAWKAGVGHFFWFSLRDFPTEGKSFSETVQSGLYFPGETLEEDQPKKVLYAFRFPFVAFPEEEAIFFWGRTPKSTGGRVKVEIKAGGGWRSVAVARADKAGIFQGTIEGSYGQRRRGFLRARYRGEMAVPFSLREHKDFYQPPFG